MTDEIEQLLTKEDFEKYQDVLVENSRWSVPLAPRVVRGLINLRGQIVTAIDLRRRLGLNDRPAGQLPMNVVMQSQDGAASLLVPANRSAVQARRPEGRGPGDCGSRPGTSPKTELAAPPGSR